MNENQMNNNYNNTEIKIDKKFIIMFKFRQLIQYGVSIERIVFPKSYEYANDFLKGLDKVETGEDENIHISTNMGVPIVFMKETYISKNFDNIAKRMEKL